VLGPVAPGLVVAVLAAARRQRAVAALVGRTNAFLGAAVVAANPVASVVERRSLAHPSVGSGAGVGGTGGGVALVGGMGGGAANIS
jgi:hypothetical protein